MELKSKHVAYSLYMAMISRCYNKGNVSYDRYGGRGIKVCDLWLSNFDSFANWVLGNGYHKGLQIDRIDNDGNYEPDNCRFVTPAQNNRNRVSNVKVEYNGRYYHYWELEQISGIKKKLIRERVVDYGMTVQEAISIEPNYRRKKHGNKTQYSTLSDIQKGK